MKVGGDSKSCPICNTPLEKGVADYNTLHNGRVCIVNNVPVLYCPECSRNFFFGGLVRSIEEKFVKLEEKEIYEYSDVGENCIACDYPLEVIGTEYKKTLGDIEYVIKNIPTFHCTNSDCGIECYDTKVLEKVKKKIREDIERLKLEKTIKTFEYSGIE